MTRTFNSGNVLADKVHRRECFERGHIATARHHHIGLAALVVAGPFPDADAGAAMLDRLVHRQPHRRGLFAGDDHVDVIAAAQAMVGDGEQAVRIGRQIDAHDFGFLVHDVVDEAGILMREAVVVLAPDVRAEQVVERGDGPPPRNVIADLQPFRVLVEHRVDDVNERFVAGEEAVPAREQITFEPALALVLAQHFHHAAIGREIVVVIEPLRHPGAVRDFQRVLPAVRVVLVGAEQAEVFALHVQLHHVAEKFAHHARGLGVGGAGLLHFDGVFAEIGHAQIAQEQAAIAMRVGTHAAFALGRDFGQFRFEAAIGVEEFLRLVALHPLVRGF